MTDATDPQVTSPVEASPDDQPNPRGLPKRLRGTRDAQDIVPVSAVARSHPPRLDTALEHAKICARIAADNRAKDVLLLDLRAATPLVDFFVIASASSRRLAASLAFEIDADMKKLSEFKLGIEGSEEGRWTLIDYGDFVVHLFSDEARTYFGLEDLWGDAIRVDWREPSRIPAAENVERQA